MRLAATAEVKKGPAKASTLETGETWPDPTKLREFKLQSGMGIKKRKESNGKKKKKTAAPAFADVARTKGQDAMWHEP